jgi:ElaB/YqjD/DUF883 family membrane-anchored ribosome-binding protein
MNNPSEHGSTFREQQGRSDTGRPESSGTMGAVKDKARELASGAAEMAGQVREKAQQAWDATSRQAREWAGDVARTTENAWEGFGNTIRRYPVASLLIAFGVGFVLGGGLGFGARRSNWS